MRRRFGSPSGSTVVLVVALALMRGKRAVANVNNDDLASGWNSRTPFSRLNRMDSKIRERVVEQMRNFLLEPISVRRFACAWLNSVGDAIILHSDNKGTATRICERGESL